MKTLVFESEAAKAIVGTEEVVSLVVTLSITMEKFLKYETPFGKTYSWAAAAELESVRAEFVNYSKGRHESIDVLSDVSNYELSAEIASQVNKFLRSIGT